jgi:cytochrome c556
MLGFKAGATVSIEETVAAFDRVFGKGGKFGNATKELAKTFEGTLSMIGDKVFNFKKVLLEAGFFAELKNQFGDLNKFLEDNSKQIDGIAKKIGSTLGRAVAGIANNMKKVKENIHGFRIAIEVLISLNVVIFLSNVAKALMLVAKSSVLLGIGMSATKKGIIGIIAAGALLKGVFLGVDKLFENLLKDIEELSKWQHTFGGNPFEKTRQSIAGLSDEAKKLSDEFDKAFNANRISRSHDAMHEMMNETQKGTLTLKERFDELNKTSIEKLQNHFLNIKETIAVGINNAITKVSQGLARSLILGENLSETFKKMAQELLIRILSITIEIIARKGIELALERLKTAELTKQLSLRSAMSAISMFTGFGFFGGQQHGGVVSKGKPVLVGERGPELFVPNTTGQITQNARGTGGGPVNVNFSITTLDASGFSEMLVQNRGTISAIINQAVNERGASNIV